MDMIYLVLFESVIDGSTSVSQVLTKAIGVRRILSKVVL